MDFSAPPTGQVRHTLVGGGEIPVLNTLQNSEHQSPSKGMNTNENNAKPPTLTQRRDGSYRLLYSTKNDIAYKTYSERGVTTRAAAGVPSVQPGIAMTLTVVDYNN